MSTSVLFVTGHLLIELALIVRVMVRPHREPASRIAWVVVIASIPLIGILAYLLFGEVNIGKRRVARLHDVLERMPELAKCVPGDEEHIAAAVPHSYEHLFQMGRSISGFSILGGNSARLMADSNCTIDEMVADMDAAQDHIHVLFYIWLPDNNGCKVVQALKRAAGRGVKCRAMVDNLGSRLMLESDHWKDMAAAGVHVAVALPIGNPLLRIFRGRIDLRNHRKIVVIDDKVTYCGSQNCADPEFRVKPKYAPWVDAVMRFEGPIVRQNQHVFASDWMTYTNENIDELLQRPISAPKSGFPAQVVATGPTSRASAMPQMFESLINAARQEVMISSPYYVPNESLQNALCSSASRGVKTTIIFPAVNDSWIVSGASRSYYKELLEAGVTIYEYVGGLLHTKSLTLDGEVTLIGSANMDRRSFDLNYENNILFVDRELTAAFQERQQQYIARSTLVSGETVDSWSLPFRLWNNTLALLGPIL
ncbi:MAG: cardiolipin synthase [Planctomycetaceae bacterium]|jgi:cardiolipin synthase A/B|nr:cardiolipin synthase [Planctomycetaceae bacterium]MDC0273161.1 cardiolipin synthase [Planctomycetaceae bacterium]MDG2388783.1 cardiolipin synthase [Planctomycetaceae bacterium]